MEAICFSETSVETQRTIRGHIPEDDTLHNRRCEKLKSNYNVNQQTKIQLVIIYNILVVYIVYNTSVDTLGLHVKFTLST
jgi:hypothetical protein